MAIRTFIIDLDDEAFQAAVDRAQDEGKTIEDALAALLSAYARGYAVGLTTYTVKRGDSLSRIAREFYGDPHKYPILQEANNLADPGRIWVGQVLVIPALEAETPPPEPPAVPPPPPPEPESPVPEPAPAPPPEPEPPIPEPAPISPPEPEPPIPEPAPVSPPEPEPPPQTVDPCAAIPGESYGTLPIVGPPTDRPADKHGDINLSLRGYSKTDAPAELIDMSGPADPRAPQLAGFFSDNRTGKISTVYRVNHWEWSNNTRGRPIDEFQVTLVGFEVEPGEPLHVPQAGYDIGRGYQVLVLYATKERITLKYTGEDTVATGYALHVEGICTEPSLLALYEQMNEEGRGQLPALRAGQAFGRAIEAEVRVAIRDTGRFMDPRVRKDWWIAR